MSDDTVVLAAREAERIAAFEEDTGGMEGYSKSNDVSDCTEPAENELLYSGLRRFLDTKLLNDQLHTTEEKKLELIADNGRWLRYDYTGVILDEVMGQYWWASFDGMKEALYQVEGTANSSLGERAVRTMYDAVKTVYD